MYIMPPDFVRPRVFITLYRCLLTTLAKTNHTMTIHQLFIPYLTTATGISSPSSVQVSTRELAVSFLSEGISIFARAFVLTGLELETSRAQRERRIDSVNLTALHTSTVF